MKYFLITISLTLGFLGTAYANGLGGQRLEKTVGQYIVDIGTDQMLAPVAGSPVEFDFNLLKGDTRELLDYTSVWVSISKNSQSYLSGNIIPAAAGPTLILFNFPESGNYELNTVFYKNDKAVADATFSLPIANGPGNFSLIATIFKAIMNGFIPFAIGAAAVFLFLKSPSIFLRARRK